MITTERQRQAAPTRVVATPRIWAMMIMLAALPFMLRLNLDGGQLQLQAVQSLYRTWRWSHEGRQLKTGESVIFTRRDEKSAYEDFFLRQMQKDFKIVEFGDVPRVGAYFEEHDRLRGRIEIFAPGSLEPATAWQGESHLSDNGLILGPWTGALLALAGQPLWATVATSMVITLAWDSGGNLLEIPARVMDLTRSFAQEMRERFRRRDWVAGEMGRVPMIGALLWLVCAALLWAPLRERFHRSLGPWALLMVASLVMEPLCLWSGGLFGKWDAGASWWKVYAGSFAYRFFFFAAIFAAYLRPHSLQNSYDPQAASIKPVGRTAWAPLLLPLCFLLAGGWDWLSAALVPGPAETLLRLRTFLVGWIFAFCLGSRIFTLWLGIFVFAVYAPPTTGHWNASAVYGLLTDGLLVGWWMSPYKGFGGWTLGGRPALVLAAIAWICGVLLSSVGVPLGVCWLALAAAVWGYIQSTDSVAFAKVDA
ncbi:MAG: hypothetical protein JST16_09385 [Bdellovibrionales bacterium]|nr:hypothetical protein [Bdellovibrionales bacterium]